MRSFRSSSRSAAARRGHHGFFHRTAPRFDEAARSIPLIFSPIMSVGVNVLFRLTEMAARVLGEEYDVEVFEAHHVSRRSAAVGQPPSDSS